MGKPFLWIKIILLLKNHILTSFKDVVFFSRDKLAPYSLAENCKASFRATEYEFGFNTAWNVHFLSPNVLHTKLNLIAQSGDLANRSQTLGRTQNRTEKLLSWKKQLCYCTQLGHTCYTHKKSEKVALTPLRFAWNVALKGNFGPFSRIQRLIFDISWQRDGMTSFIFLDFLQRHVFAREVKRRFQLGCC